MTPAVTKRREERVRLFATFLSNTGVGSAVAGVIAPVASGRSDPLGFALAILAAAVLHLTAQAVLHYVVPVSDQEAA